MFFNFNFHFFRYKTKFSIFKGARKEPSKKLAIGDDDTVVKKELLSSKLHCKPDSVPQDVFNIIVKFLQE